MKNSSFSQQQADFLAHLMAARRDVRGNHFISTPIPQQAIEQILEAAAVAPSVGFSQPWEFVLVNDLSARKAMVKNFNHANDMAKNQFTDEKNAIYQRLKLEGILEAPINIAVFYRPSKLPVLGQTSMEEVGRYSVVCAIQNMWLMARALNIGMGWVSILDPNLVKEQLNAPKDAELIGYLCLGYVDEFLSQPELEKLNWEKRKAIKDCVFTDQYPSSNSTD